MYVRSYVLASIAGEQLPKFTFFVLVILLGQSVLTFFAYEICLSFSDQAIKIPSPRNIEKIAASNISDLRKFEPIYQIFF